MNSSLLELRLSLADSRSQLRHAKDAHDLARAEAEQRAIDAGANGKNAEERGRNLTLALSQDAAYTRALAQLRQAEAEVDRLDALLEGARDARRADEWQIRARLADGLFRAGVRSDDPASDEAWEDVADAELTGRAVQVAGQNGTDEFPDEEFPF